MHYSDAVSVLNRAFDSPCLLHMESGSYLFRFRFGRDVACTCVGPCAGTSTSTCAGTSAVIRSGTCASLQINLNRGLFCLWEAIKLKMYRQILISRFSSTINKKTG